MVYYSSVRVVYYRNNLIGYTEDDLSRYYRSLIPKYYYVKPPAYDSHITIVRSFPIENPPNKDQFWNKYQDEIVPIEYDNTIYNNGLYWYLDARSIGIEKIRLELGLPAIRPPFDCFHITVGNTK